MVRTTTKVLAAATIACCTWTTGTSVVAQEGCQIHTVELLEPAPANIIRGEPLTVLLRITATFPRTSTTLSVEHASKLVVRALSQSVQIDGHVFRNTLSSGSINEVARFTPTRTKSNQFGGAKTVAPETAYQFECTASLYLRASKNRIDFVFSSPGVHEIIVGDPRAASATVLVGVEEATPAEDALLAKLVENPEVLLFLADPSDCTNSTAHVGRVLESTLERYPDTRLQKYIRFAFGVSSFCELRRDRQESMEAIGGSNSPTSAESSHDIEAVFRSGYIELADYFYEPPAERNWSEFDLLAVWHNAEIELARARNASSVADGEIHIAEYLRLLASIEGNRASSIKWIRKSESRDEVVESVRAAIRTSDLNER